MDYYDQEGNKVDVITKEEHEKQLQQAAADIILNAQKEGKIVTTEEHNKVTTKIQELETALTKANEDLEKASGADRNFAALREAKDKAEKELKEFKDQVGTKLQQIEKQLPGNDIDGMIAQLAGGDTDVSKKIKFHFDRISKPEDTLDERKQKLIDAATLAKGSRPAPNVIAGIVSGAGAYAPEHMHDREAGAELSQEQRQLASKLGITDKDVDNFGKKPLSTK